MSPRAGLHDALRHVLELVDIRNAAAAIFLDDHRHGRQDSYNRDLLIRVPHRGLWRLAMLRRLAIACFAIVVIASPAAAQSENCPGQDVIFVPTPQEVVDEMLKVANVTSRDVVIDICDLRIKEANANLKTAGVSDKVKFLQQDMFKTDISEATVVTMYLLPT